MLIVFFHLKNPLENDLTFEKGKKISNFVSDSLNENEYHNFKLGDGMIKNYNNRKVKFTFFFDNNGKNLKDILETCYREEIRNEQILTGGVGNDLQKTKNDIIIHS